MSMWSRIRTDERGVSAVIVAISLVGIFGAAMLSIDAGNLWQSRRNMITGTDATALQEARLAALSGASAACASTSVNTMLQNNSGSGLSGVTCTTNTAGTPGTGYVTVSAAKPVDVRFGGPVGIGDGTAPASSTAQYGFITEALGLRPMGFCYKNSHVQEWLNYQHWLRTGTNITGQPLVTTAVYNALEDTGDTDLDGRPDHPSGPGVNGNGSPSYGSGVIHRLYFQRLDGTAECGGAPGNWGWYDFDGGANSNADQQDWIDDGYPDSVGVNDCNADGVTGDACSGDTGSSGGSNNQELNDLIASGMPFAIPLFTTATGTGAGATFDVYGFVGVKLKGYRMTGPNASRYFDFEFVELILEGNCCTGTPNDFGIMGVKICSVDHDPQSITSRCQL